MMQIDIFDNIKSPIRLRVILHDTKQSPAGLTIKISLLPVRRAHLLDNRAVHRSIGDPRGFILRQAP